VRLLQSAAVSPEQVCFPAAAQIGQLYRKLGKHRPETVAVLTSRPPEALDARGWLDATRAYWGIENGMHQRLDVTAMEDQCKVRTPEAVWILGMFRRLAVSLFVEWRSRDPKRKWTTLTDFYSEMSAEGHSTGFRLLTARRPTLARWAS
jgi:hypothetical protein